MSRVKSSKEKKRSLRTAGQGREVVMAGLSHTLKYREDVGQARALRPFQAVDSTC